MDTRYDPGDPESLVVTLVDAVARAAGVSRTEVPVINDAIDLDALGRLFDGHGEAAAGNPIVSFRLDNWNVFVRADGRIRVCDGSKAVEPAPVFDGTTA